MMKKSSPEMPVWESSEQIAVNTLGHGAGVLIFAIFLHLLVRRGLAGGRGGRLSMLAAALALVWNLASLGVVSLGGEGKLAERVAAAVGFSALSMLPAVLLHLSLMNRWPSISWSGYGLSGFAVAAHIVELVGGQQDYHRIGLAAITVGFAALACAAAAKTLWTGDRELRAGPSRLLATMALLLFSMSFVHFGDGHTYQAWSAELAVHHAGIPLALFMLLQDYRFVLLDAFVRFLANGLLAGLFAVAIAHTLPGHGFAIQTLGAAAMLAAFAVTREFVQTLLTRIVFRRSDPEETVRALQALRSQCAGEEEYLRRAFGKIAAFMGAPAIEAEGVPPGANLLTPTPVTQIPGAKELMHRGVHVAIPVRLSHGDTRFALLGERRGGQPYLSEDLDALARLAACIAEQVEQVREAEIQRLVSQAEFRALQSQIHPHFLFNAFNTLYGVIPRESATARNMLLNLSDIFRYFLQSDKSFVPLEEEIRIVQAYLSIEKLRLGDKLRTEIAMDPAAGGCRVPVLSIQPLVENAVKHGVAAQVDGGVVRIAARQEDGGVRVTVSDTGPGFGTEKNRSAMGTGVGLDNVAQRLRLCYGEGAALSIDSGPAGSTVSFFAPAEAVPA